jgi:hypothetical protein
VSIKFFISLYIVVSKYPLSIDELEWGLFSCYCSRKMRTAFYGTHSESLLPFFVR